MNPELITRLISLVERTGDRVVLADPETGKAVVVMDLSSYERLCTSGVKAESVAAPAVFKEPESEPRISPPKSQKTAENAVIPAKMARVVEPAPAAPVSSGLTDLTQAELLDKINREIAAWKTAQESKRTEELKAAAKTVSPFVAAGVFEEEERFYLEPIE